MNIINDNGKYGRQAEANLASNLAFLARERLHFRVLAPILDAL